MEIDIKNTDLLPTGAFILNENRVPFVPFQGSKFVFLTEENSPMLKSQILKLINESKRVLKLCSFIITDNEVFQAILNKAKNTNTPIFILTQLDQKKLSNSVSLLDFITEEEIRENPAQTHLNYIKRLFDNGVHVRASTFAHAKFIVADRKVAFMTSANLTTPSLSFNMESGVYLDEESSSELDTLFDVIFQQGTSYRQFISSSKKNKMFVVQSEVAMNKKFLPNPARSRLRYTYENEADNLFREMIRVIDEATDFLYISTYSIVGLEFIDDFVQALGRANKRGVLIKLFCRGMNYRYDHLVGSQILHMTGCEIFGDMYNHSKGLISEKSGLIFTANIDGNHGLINGFEVGYILDETQRLEFLKIHHHLIESAYYIYPSKPTRIELFQTYGEYEASRGIKPPEFPRDVLLTVQEGLKVNHTDLTGQPLFYGRSNSDEYIIAGNSYYKCKFREDKFILTGIENPRFDLEKYILKYVNLKITLN